MMFSVGMITRCRARTSSPQLHPKGLKVWLSRGCSHEPKMGRAEFLSGLTTPTEQSVCYGFATTLQGWRTCQPTKPSILSNRRKWRKFYSTSDRWIGLGCLSTAPFSGRGISNPQSNPQFAMSCPTCRYFGSPAVLVSLASRCET